MAPHSTISKAKLALLRPQASFMIGDEPSTAVELAVWFMGGALVGMGTVIGGMTHRTSLGFFDIAGSGKYGAVYSPGILVFFISALSLPLLYWQIFKRPTKPVLGKRYQLPTRREIDFKLVAGAALFGLGWALGGFCPGSSIPGLLTGKSHYLASVAGLTMGYVGMVLYDYMGNKMAPSIIGKPMWRVYLAGLLQGVLPFVALSWIGPRLLPNVPVPTPDNWPLTLASAGGFMIGLASVMMMHLNGAQLGTSSILRRLLDPVDRSHRLATSIFVTGLVLGSALAGAWHPAAFSVTVHPERSPFWIFVGGVLVAIGTSIGNGCTSGHGICGVPRLAPRSIIAVATMMTSVFISLPIIDGLLP